MISVLDGVTVFVNCFFFIEQWEKFGIGEHCW